MKRTGLLLRAASVALADIDLEVGGLEDVITVTAEGQNNITLESPAISRGLDAQQLRDLPRNSRDVQDFLTLNPNVVGGFDAIQFLGGRTYGVSYVQDGQPSGAGIFGEVSNAAPGLDAISEMQVLSNSYSAEYGGLAGVVISTKRGANQFHGSGFYDFNSNALNALTYAETLNGVSRDDPNADTHEHRYGVSFGGPIITNRTFFFGNYEGSRLKAARRRRAGDRADGRDARRRLLGDELHHHAIRRPACPSRAIAFRPTASTRPHARSSTSSTRSPTRQPLAERVRRLPRRSCRSTATATGPTSASITS